MGLVEILKTMGLGGSGDHGAGGDPEDQRAGGGPEDHGGGGVPEDHGAGGGPAFPSPGDLPSPGIEPGVSCIVGGFFTV